MSYVINNKYLLNVIMIFIITIFPFVKAFADSSVSFKTLKTRHTVLHYTSDEVLLKFNRKIQFYPKKGSLKRLMAQKGSNDIRDIVKNKVDAIFEKAQQILDMRKKMKRVKINIYGNKKKICEAFIKIYKQGCRFRAWYIFENNTVYVNVEDLHEGILAHELGHAIIDHYLLVRPPSATAEILARYVDKHLKRKGFTEK